MLRHRDLTYPELVFPGGRTDVRSLFPFFQADGAVSFCLIEIEDGAWTWTEDRPREAEPRRIVYEGRPELTRPVTELVPGSFVDLFHFDPWQRMDHVRRGVDVKLVRIIKATNLAGRSIGNIPVHGVDFRRDLGAAESVLLDNGMFIRRRISGEEMSAALRSLAGEIWAKWPASDRKQARKPKARVAEPETKE